MTNERILIVGLNWIGDAIMSMPAIQACRAENPAAHISILVKPYLEPLWEMHPAIDGILCLQGMADTVGRINALDFDKAFILPNSFRSALIPFASGIRSRIGMRGQLRRLMLTKVVPVAAGHQSNEYFPIMAPKSVELVKEYPELNVPDMDFRGLGEYAVLMPGAARGASKMWPLGHFEELALRITNATNLNIVFAGGKGDAPACDDLAAKLGARASSLAGETGLKEWAALLKRSRIAVANDSGGMHLAAAVGTPVVGIYGTTDPDKTGPLARRFRVIQNSEVKARNIARDSGLARQALASISPEQVYAAVEELLPK